MRPAILMALQTTAPAVPPAVIVGPIDFDLAKVPVGKCGTESYDIVVCGRRGTDRHRLTVPPPADRRLPRAEARLFGKVRAAVEVEQATLPNGMTSNRAMLRLKLPF